jgi:hypothetical protein
MVVNILHITTEFSSLDSQVATESYMKKSAFLICFFVIVSASVFAKTGNQIDSTNQLESQVNYQVLLIGNSHSSFNGLPNLLTTLIETGSPGTSASASNASGYKFLSDRVGDGVTLELLQSRQWTHVILQAQKYSSSGKYYYSTAAAQQWIRLVKAQNARPILFPEWPRWGNQEEGQRIHDLHLSISSRETACVAPIGLAWEESIARKRSLRLHAADGNHSNLEGALLTAYVLYFVTTGQSPAELPFIPSIDVTAANQQHLRTVAAEVVIANQADCADMNSTSNGGGPSEATALPDPRIPTLNFWGMLVLILGVAFIGIRLR